MKRSQIVLAVVAAILIIALFYLLLFQPKRDEVAELEVQIAAQQEQQALIQAEIDRLRAVRDEAPEVEAELVAAEAVLPHEPALPPALRQLQLAADDAGLTLQSVSTSRPVAIDGAPEGLSSIDVNLQLLGSYFEVVDFLRRVEDPTITPRGLTWNNATVARDEYPSLSVSLSGRIYAILEVPPAEETAPTEDPEAEADDTAADEDVDVDVEADVDTQTEDAS